VLANKAKQRRISDEVVERVRKVAAELDYSPNLLVHSLQKGKTQTLSFYNAFRKRSIQDIYLDRLSMALELAGGELGFDILVYCVFNRTVEDTYRYLNGGRCDGLLLFAPVEDDPLLPYLRNSRLPTVLINTVDKEGALSFVKEDHIAGMRQVAENLHELGHRRIAALTNVPNGNPDADLRIELLRRFLAEHGISIPDRWVLQTDDMATVDAERAVTFLMSEPEPPTALFCWHDRLGYQVVEQCDRLGIAIPEQVSVVGYDGLRWPAIARHVLASVHVDLVGIAHEAVALAKQLIDGEIQEPAGKVVGVTFDYGTTLAEAPARR
jgi:DNA-binding LacI/PurR family transcriptional regulator